MTFDVSILVCSLAAVRPVASIPRPTFFILFHVSHLTRTIARGGEVLVEGTEKGRRAFRCNCERLGDFVASGIKTQGTLFIGTFPGCRDYWWWTLKPSSSPCKSLTFCCRTPWWNEWGIFGSTNTGALRLPPVSPCMWRMALPSIQVDTWSWTHFEHPSTPAVLDSLCR